MSVSKEELLEKMKEADLVVLNVLSEEEFQRSHIRGSRNLTLTQDYGDFAHEVEKRYGKVRSFILYGSDATSAEGANAARILRGHDFNAQDYPGGMREWLAAGLPVEGSWVHAPKG